MNFEILIFLELKKKIPIFFFFFFFLSMRQNSIYANGFIQVRVSSLDETRGIWLAKIATSRLPFSSTLLK